MEWLTNLIMPGTAEQASVASSLLILSMTAALGFAVGNIRVKGVSLGVAGVLFAGLLLGHLGLRLPVEVLEFVREFGLILFVYTIGIQVGPSFLGSLRRQGLSLNLLSALVVLLGVGVTVAIHFLGGVPKAAAVGLFAGATTNTPSLAAAQQALRDQTTVDAVRAMPGLGYAVAYPFGVLGIILTMLAVRFAFRIDVNGENQLFLRTEAASKPRLAVRNLRVKNPNLQDLAIKDIPLPPHSGVVISRVMHEGKVTIAQPETRLAVDDVVIAVGPAESLDRLRIVVGVDADVDLSALPSRIETRRLIGTHKGALGKTIDEMELGRYGITITRILRADIELPVSAQVRLSFGDTLVAVGEPESIANAAREVGDSPKALNHPLVVPIFVGISLGVVVGSWPFYIAGLPAAVKLGLAGGPLLVAIVLSRVGKVGPLVWYMPVSANFMLREVGIALFLACVGLKAGDRFVETLVTGDGFKWMALAALITVVPILVVSLIARLWLKMNYLSLCGLLAGSMTDPPALAFVTASTGSDGPSIAYASVYPMTMFLRVLMAQVLVLLLA